MSNLTNQTYEKALAMANAMYDKHYDMDNRFDQFVIELVKDEKGTLLVGDYITSGDSGRLFGTQLEKDILYLAYNNSNYYEEIVDLMEAIKWLSDKEVLYVYIDLFNGSGIVKKIFTTPEEVVSFSEKEGI